MNINKLYRKTIVATVFALMASVFYSVSGYSYTVEEYRELYNEKYALEIEVKRLRDEMARERARLEAIIVGLRSDIARLQREKQELEKTIAEKDEEIARLEALIKEKDTKIEQLEKEKSDLEKQLAEAQAKIQELNGQLTAAKQEADAAKTENSRLSAEIEALKKEIAQLKEELEKARLAQQQDSTQASGEDGQRATEGCQCASSNIDEQLAAINQGLADDIAKGNVKVFKKDNEIIVQLLDAYLFAPGSARLKGQDVKEVIHKITGFGIKDPDNKIVVMGHTDNTPIRTAQYRDNWQLSTGRALSVLYEMLKTDGMNPSKVNVGFYGAGEYQPMESNETADGRALNRRVDIIIRPKIVIAETSSAEN